MPDTERFYSVWLDSPTQQDHSSWCLLRSDGRAIKCVKDRVSLRHTGAEIVRKPVLNRVRAEWFHKVVTC